MIYLKEGTLESSLQKFIGDRRQEFLDAYRSVQDIASAVRSVLKGHNSDYEEKDWKEGGVDEEVYKTFFFDAPYKEYSSKILQDIKKAVDRMVGLVVQTDKNTLSLAVSQFLRIAVKFWSTNPSGKPGGEVEVLVQPKEYAFQESSRPARRGRRLNEYRRLRSRRIRENLDQFRKVAKEAYGKYYSGSSLRKIIDRYASDAFYLGDTILRDVRRQIEKDFDTEIPEPNWKPASRDLDAWQAVLDFGDEDPKDIKNSVDSILNRRTGFRYHSGEWDIMFDRDRKKTMTLKLDKGNRLIITLHCPSSVPELVS